MKNIIAILSLLVTMAAGAQKSTQNISISYSMKVENSPAAALMGDMHINIFFKNGQYLTEMGGANYSLKTLVNDSGTLILSNSIAAKFFSKEPPRPKKQNSVEPDVTYIDSTKEIAGFTCKKALVMVNHHDDKDTAVFWYTEKLPVIAFGEAAKLFQGLRGMPLEYTVSGKEMKITLVAIKVSTDPIPDAVFQLSTEGYNELPGIGLKGGQQ